jgi:hypothetical protein
MGMDHPSTVLPGRLVVVDEGGEFVHLDMYRTHNALIWMRISVSRSLLRLYAERLLEAANRT